MRTATILASIGFIIIFSSNAASGAQDGSGSFLSNLLGGLQWQPDALNSESEVIGNYQIVVATDPLSPKVNDTTHFTFKVYNYNQGAYASSSSYAETGVNHFTMGVRVFYNDRLVHEFLPQLHKGNSWAMDYTFRESGNHVFKVDLYDTGKDNGVITYIFNIPVDTIFGPIFQYILIAAAVAVAGTILWVKLRMVRKNPSR